MCLYGTFTASHECDHHRVTILRTLVMGSVVILIGYTHVSTTTAALGHLSQASAAHDQTDRPPREAATDGICDQPRPQYAFGTDQSTHQLISIAQVHAMPEGCLHRLQRQPPQHEHEPPRPASCARSCLVAAAQYITRGGFIAASTSAGGDCCSCGGGLLRLLPLHLRSLVGFLPLPVRILARMPG